MRIKILALGTRGDVQPLIALGLGLQSAGYDVCVIVDERYMELVKQYGLVCFPIKGIEHMFAKGEVWNRMEDCWHACHKADAIVFSPHPFSIIGYHIAENLDIPCFWAASFPMHPLEGISQKMLPGKNIYGFYNRQFHFMVNHWREK